MALQVTLDHLRAAHRARDPQFVELLTNLIGKRKVNEPPIREGAYTFDHFLAEQHSPAFKRKSLDEKALYRIEKLAALEADSAEVSLPDWLRCHEVLMELWQDEDFFGRHCLLRVIEGVPLVYGPFKALKTIFKEAEARNDTEVFGALAARFDMALASGEHSVSQRTLSYLVRRGWRYLRRIGEGVPGDLCGRGDGFLNPLPGL